MVKVISYSNEPFRNRQEAGRFLAEELKYLAGRRVVVLGIPRGGIVVAREISLSLDAKLDIVLSRKLRAPGNPELGIGAVSERGKLFLNKDLAWRVGADQDYIEAEKARQSAEIKNRAQRFREVKKKVSLKDKVVIVTDDGVATGATMQAALWAISQEKPNKVIAAIPVGAKESLDLLADYADEVVVLRLPDSLGAIAQFYINFEQTSEEEVLKILKEAAEREGVKMAKMPEELRDFLTAHLAYVATADEKGRPNVVPKGDMAILDNHTIVFADLYSHQTKKNLSKNPNIAIMVVNPAAYRGYQIKGKAKIIERGKAFDSIANQTIGHGQFSHPDAKYAVKVTVSKVIDISYGDTGDKEL